MKLKIKTNLNLIFNNKKNSFDIELENDPIIKIFTSDKLTYHEDENFGAEYLNFSKILKARCDRKLPRFDNKDYKGYDYADVLGFYKCRFTGQPWLRIYMGYRTSEKLAAHYRFLPEYKYKLKEMGFCTKKDLNYGSLQNTTNNRFIDLFTICWTYKTLLHQFKKPGSSRSIINYKPLQWFVTLYKPYLYWNILLPNSGYNILDNTISNLYVGSFINTNKKLSFMLNLKYKKALYKSILLSNFISYILNFKLNLFYNKIYNLFNIYFNINFNVPLTNKFIFYNNNIKLNYILKKSSLILYNIKLNNNYKFNSIFYQKSLRELLSFGFNNWFFFFNSKFVKNLFTFRRRIIYKKKMYKLHQIFNSNKKLKNFLLKKKKNFWPELPLVTNIKKRKISPFNMIKSKLRRKRRLKKFKIWNKSNFFNFFKIDKFLINKQRYNFYVKSKKINNNYKKIPNYYNLKKLKLIFYKNNKYIFNKRIKFYQKIQESKKKFNNFNILSWFNKKYQKSKILIKKIKKDNLSLKILNYNNKLLKNKNFNNLLSLFFNNCFNYFNVFFNFINDFSVFINKFSILYENLIKFSYNILNLEWPAFIDFIDFDDLILIYNNWWDSSLNLFNVNLKLININFDNIYLNSFYNWLNNSWNTNMHKVYYVSLNIIKNKNIFKIKSNFVFYLKNIFMLKKWYYIKYNINTFLKWLSFLCQILLVFFFKSFYSISLIKSIVGLEKKNNLKMSFLNYFFFTYKTDFFFRFYKSRLSRRARTKFTYIRFGVNLIKSNSFSISNKKKKDWLKNQLSSYAIPIKNFFFSRYNPKTWKNHSDVFKKSFIYLNLFFKSLNRLLFLNGFFFSNFNNNINWILEIKYSFISILQFFWLIKNQKLNYYIKNIKNKIKKYNCNSFLFNIYS